MENHNHKGGGEHKPQDDNRTLMGILSYLGILIVIPFLVSKNDTFVKFHLKQGFVLFVIEIIVWLGMGIFWPLIPLFFLINIGVVILIIIGILNVVNKREKALPVVGKFSRHVNI